MWSVVRVSKIVPYEEFLESFFRLCDRKLCAIDDSVGIKAGQLISQVVRGMRRFCATSLMRVLILRGTGMMRVETDPLTPRTFRPSGKVKTAGLRFRETRLCVAWRKADLGASNPPGVPLPCLPAHKRHPEDA